MKPLAAITCANAVLAIVMTYSMQSATLPMWPMVIAWGCFFHLGGSDRPPAAIVAVLSHAVLGVAVGWLAALAILIQPLPALMPSTLWVPLVIGAAVGVMSAAAWWPRLAITPVCVYGFAANWAYLDTPGRFDVAVLTALRMDNVIIALPLALFAGCLFGWANARLIARLMQPSRPLPDSV
jgi:hypothetical protein